jgi:hypothetical protein
MNGQWKLMMVFIMMPDLKKSNRTLSAGQSHAALKRGAACDRPKSLVSGWAVAGLVGLV